MSVTIHSQNLIELIYTVLACFIVIVDPFAWHVGRNEECGFLRSYEYTLDSVTSIW